MRSFRGVAVAALLALDVSAAAAQSTRHFYDSWFWGLKGGAMFYQVQSVQGTAIAPGVGLDWMITRTHGGLYVAYDQSFLTDQVALNDSVGPTAFTPNGRLVDLNGMRRFTMLGMLFPMPSYRFQPYFGLGGQLSYIARAEPQGSFANRVQQDLVLSTITQFRACTTPLVMLGLQWRLPMVSAFVQGTAVPANDNFFLFTGTAWRSTAEAGLRYNIGSSIDRMR